mmetsp:Transcript_4262/g.14193  ORF Transcript_4262/g.14193 Transcript_4262/m.14193 type:complete len:249 (-) Transcript_4262:1338-2084(-)
MNPSPQANRVLFWSRNRENLAWVVFLSEAYRPSRVERARSHSSTAECCWSFSLSPSFSFLRKGLELLFIKTPTAATLAPSLETSRDVKLSKSTRCRVAKRTYFGAVVSSVPPKRRHAMTRGEPPICAVTRVSPVSQNTTHFTNLVWPSRICCDCLLIEPEGRLPVIPLSPFAFDSSPPETSRTTTALSHAYAAVDPTTANEVGETQEAPNTVCSVSALGVVCGIRVALLTGADCLPVLSNPSFGNVVS